MIQRALARIIVRHRSYGSNKLRNLRYLGLGILLFLFLAVFSYTRADMYTRVEAATADTLNFQARLYKSDGSKVADGNYSIAFNLYDAAAGGVSEWSETQSSVAIKNGYLSVELGSVTPFLSSIDWSQAKWLTMNVNSDGEMNPRIKLTATPYSMLSEQANSLTNGSTTITANDLVQLAPGTPQVINSALAALRINQTGAGMLAQLQNNGSDVMTVGADGAITSGGTLTITANGASITGGIDNNSGGLTEVGNITGVGTSIAANAGLTISSGGTSDLTFDSASGVLVLAANDSTLRRTASGTFTVDLVDSGTTSLSLSNSGAGVADLNLVDGALQTNGATRIANNGALQNVTGDNTDGVSLNANTITSGVLSVVRGGTGTGSFTTNGILFGNGTSSLQVTAAGTGGQLLLANSSGVPAFVSMTGDISLNSSGLATIATNSVALGTDTTGNYIATITGGNGLTVSGVGTETATASIGLDIITTGTTSTTSSNSGLELTADGLSLFRGCSNGQVMEWNGGAGEWNCATDNQGLSDSTIKTNVSSLGSVLDTIKNLNVVDFNFKCSDPLWSSYRFTCDDQTGVLAQELALLFPELVNLRADGLNQVDFGRLNFYTLQAVTELAAFIDSSGNASLNTVKTDGVQRLSSSGALQNINGLTVVSNGASITGTTSIGGGTVNLNAGGLLTNTNINTGASTGTVTIGGGTANLVINSSAFDVTASGAVSGVTTLSASGNISTTAGVFVAGGLSGIALSCSGNQYVSGITIAGGITTSGGCSGIGLSDARLKENVVSLDSVLDGMRNINTVNFNFTCQEDIFVQNGGAYACDESLQTGVIAQELAQVFPELVEQDESGYYRVKYDALNIYTLKATSELAKTIDSQQNVTGNTVATGGAVRLNNTGQLQNITGLRMVGGGASVVGGLNNNNGGITQAGDIAGVKALTAETVRIKATTYDNLLELSKDGNGVFTVFNSGALQLKLTAENAFIVKNNQGSDVFSVNTSGGLVKVGSEQNTSAVLLVLHNVSLDSDPEGINGAQYYNSKINKFRCFQNGVWRDCISAVDSEYIIAAAPFEWKQPVTDSEIPTRQRAWVDLSHASSYRMNVQVDAAGVEGAECRLQFTTDPVAGIWRNLDSGEAYQSIAQTGVLKSDWLDIIPQGRQEVLIRVMCRGGDNMVPQTGTTVKISSIRFQVR